MTMMARNNEEVARNLVSWLASSVARMLPSCAMRDFGLLGKMGQKSPLKRTNRYVAKLYHFKFNQHQLTTIGSLKIALQVEIWIKINCCCCYRWKSEGFCLAIVQRGRQWRKSWLPSCLLTGKFAPFSHFVSRLLGGLAANHLLLVQIVDASLW